MSSVGNHVWMRMHRKHMPKNPSLSRNRSEQELSAGSSGTAALPRRPNSAGTSTAKFRPPFVTGTILSRAGTRVTEKWDARQRSPTGRMEGARFMERLHLRCVLPLVALVATACAAQAAPSPFTLNGWQFHEYDMPKLEEAVRKAPEYGVNFFIFSHGFFWSPEGFLASTDDLDPRNPPAYLNELQLGDEFTLRRGWQSDMRRIGDMATGRGIPYYIWLHEFNDVPKRFMLEKLPEHPENRLHPGRVDMDNPELFVFLERRYERLLEAVPGAAGFVLTFHESDYRLFRNSEVLSSNSVPERIHRVSRFFYDFLKKRNKQLIIRNFFYEPLEMEYFKEALDRLPNDIISMCKDTTHEFHPFYPWDPQHGQSGGKRQIIEIDLGVEKAWSSRGAYSQADYIRRAALRAREKGLAGLVGRARLIGTRPFEDMHEVNLFAFARFLENPDLTADAVLRDWAGRRYPAGAVPHIVSALKRSEYINHHGRWHLENWLTKSIGSEWDDYPYYYGHVLERARSKWSNDPADKELEEKLYHPDAETYRRLVAEKDEVVAQVAAAFEDLRQAATHATPEQLAPLMEDFRFLEDAALLQREWIRAYFSMRMYMDQPSEQYRVRMEEALAKLEEYERRPGFTYGRNAGTGRRYNIDRFVLEMRWRVANRTRALAEDARILEEVRQRLDVSSN